MRKLKTAVVDWLRFLSDQPGLQLLTSAPLLVLCVWLCCCCCCLSSPEKRNVITEAVHVHLRPVLQQHQTQDLDVMARSAKKGQQEIEEEWVQVAHHWTTWCLDWVRKEKSSPAWDGSALDRASAHLHPYLSDISRALDEGRPPPSRSPLWPALQSSLSQLLPALSSTPPAGVKSETIEKVKVEIQKFLERTNPLYKKFTVLRQKYDDLTRSTKEKEETIEKHVRELKSVTEEKDALKKDVDKMKQQEASLAGLLGRGERQRGELAREVSRLQKERQRLKLQLQHVQKEHQKSLSHLTRNIQSMNEQLREQGGRQADVLDGVAYLVRRTKETNPEAARVLGLGTLLTSTDSALHSLLLSAERHVGGRGLQFAESLLGPHPDFRDDEILRDHGFLTRRTFWLLVRRWREVSLLPDSPVPFTLQHLQHVCSSLDPDPSTVPPITAAHKDVLERNFLFLSEQLDFPSIHDHFCGSTLLTEEARQFLTDKSLKSNLQKTDRLLAVVYSLGEQGYRLLRDVMEPSGHEHVRTIFPQDDSGSDDVMARPEPDTSQAETVADAGPDHAPNLTTAAAVHDDADDDGHDVQGDDQALALQDEDRRPATAQELRGLLGTVAGILQDTSHRQEERDQTTARRIEELAQSVAGREGEMDKRMNTRMAALEARLAASTGAVQREMSESRGGVDAADRGRGLDRQTCAGRESLEAAEMQRERGSVEETAGGGERGEEHFTGVSCCFL